MHCLHLSEEMLSKDNNLHYKCFTKIILKCNEEMSEKNNL